jgi:hypothetical protein
MTYYTDGTAVYYIDIYVLENAKAMTIAGPESTKNVVIADGLLYVWEDGDETYYEAALDSAENENKLADMYQMLLTYEDVQAVPLSSITYAAYENYNDEMCVAVRYMSPNLNYLTTCYISTAPGFSSGPSSTTGHAHLRHGYDGLFARFSRRLTFCPARRYEPVGGV